MIHLALSIASFLFLCWVVFWVGVFVWVFCSAVLEALGDGLERLGEFLRGDGDKK